MAEVAALRVRPKIVHVAQTRRGRSLSFEHIFRKEAQVIDYRSCEAQLLENIVAGQASATQLRHRFAEKILRDWHEIDDASAEKTPFHGRQASL